MAYATAAELVEHLSLGDNLSAGILVSAEKTARLELALDAATTHIEDDTDRVFTSSTATKQLKSDGGDILRVPDLVSVSSLKIDDDADGTYETTLTSADYELNNWHENVSGWPYEYVVRVDDCWPCVTNGRRRLVEITGVWGWPAVPKTVKQACLIEAARLFQRANAALGVQGFSDFGAFSVRNNDPDYQSLIAPYRKHGLA